MNNIAGTGQQLLKRMTFLPAIPQRISIRERLANGLYLFLRFFLKYGFIMGCVGGGLLLGTYGYVYGAVIGALLGIWVRRSLAYRAGDHTSNYFLRLHERSCGAQPRYLESLLEGIRGAKLNCYQCRQVVNAYAVMQRDLATCVLDEEKDRVLKQFERETMIAIYGI